MNIAILGYGKEGQAVETYFKSQGAEVQVFDNFNNEELQFFDLSGFDLVFRSPSVPLMNIPGVAKLPDGTYKTPQNLTSSTKYFFEHVQSPIIGVTGTKGKGTTCSMTTAILREFGHKVHFLGNVGSPAISALDEISPDDVVVYELSSFQLWDLDRSPQFALILRIEPDHLDRHAGFTDYLGAKSNIARHQKPEDTCIYFEGNSNSVSLAELSPARTKLAYPLPISDKLTQLLSHLQIPGAHNRENAQAAILAFLAFNHSNLSTISEPEESAIIRALESFRPLPHHIEFVRNLNGVDYYDDSFSASYPSLDVAIAAFPDRPLILIAGGKDRHLDLGVAKSRIFSATNIAKLILIGETAPALAEGEDPDKYIIADALESAVQSARRAAEQLSGSKSPVVLLSPGAASFDMFKNFYDRGEKFQKLVKELN